MMIICPYCLNKHTLTPTNRVCPSCDREVPRQYIQATRKSPPVFIVTVGMSRHGKSALLDSIAVTIENLGKISPDTYHSYYDAFTFNKIQDIRREVQQHQVPDSTKLNISPEPLLIGVHNFLNEETRTLVIYDLAGEALNNIETIQDYVKPIIHAQTIWFLVSLFDLEHDREGRSIFDLIELYLSAMEQLNTPTRDRNVLIIYTKSDKMVEYYGERLPDEIKFYLGNDPYMKIKEIKLSQSSMPLFDEYAYMQEMKRISGILKDFTADEIDGGGALISRIKSTKMNLNFAITSATGADIDKNQPGVALTRYRVLDPFLWSLSTGGGGDVETQIVIIADGKSSFFATQGRLGLIYDELTAQRMSISTYVLGNPKMVAEGMRPDTLPKRDYIALLGVVMDNLPKHATPANTCILILTEKPIYDLYDYIYGEWYERIFIVNAGSPSPIWHHKLEIDDFEFDAQFIVEQFMKQIAQKE